MDFKDIKAAYFLGIGGIGMSAIARYFNYLGIKVTGYDKTETPLTKNLVQEGMDIHYTDDVKFVIGLKLNPPNTLVVITPAIPKDHQEWKYFTEQKFTIQKRAEVLGIISEAYQTIGVAGTHGKTTTSAMIAHILTQSKLGCNAFLGGISSNYESNLLIHKRAKELKPAEQFTVVEADEFDRSFLTLHPKISVITSTDADHLDIYGAHSAMQESFLDYANRLVAGGTLLVKHNLDLVKKLKVKHLTYGFDPGADVFAGNIQINEAEHIFDLYFDGSFYPELKLGIPGMHNIENAVAASAACLIAGVTGDELRKALISFKGVKRRFEYIIKNEKQIFIDDYAHHPEELRAILSSVKRMYPRYKLVVAFQPHLFSRTRDFAEGFAETLSMADKLFLLDIYPAREQPIEGVSSQMILDRMISKDKILCSKEELIEYVKMERPRLFLTLGAGDIDALVQPIKQVLSSNDH
ncbi:MAG: UDP-N-acetylmuramate--L-alanine ligase [Bacteroidota bacterium]|nr:UDP-N-acetylmuramate--L-alanine ligase [Bacteroidota bacterium]